MLFKLIFLAFLNIYELINTVTYSQKYSPMNYCKQVLKRVFLLICFGYCYFPQVVVAEQGNALPPVISVMGNSLITIAYDLVASRSLQLSRIKLTGSAIDVAAYLNLAIVLTDHPSLYIINLDNPNNPEIISNLALSGTAQSLHVSGNRAFIGTENNGVEVVDLSNPIAPVLLVENVGTGSASNINVAGIYAYVANDKKQSKPMLLGEFTSLVFHASLDDRVKRINGTSIEVFDGSKNLILAEVESGTLITPSTNYSIENDFGVHLGSLQFPGGSTDGPLIIGNKFDFKSVLNFNNSPAIIGFWFGTSSSADTAPTLLSAGRHGPYSLTNGGWSVFLYENQLRFAIGRKNHPVESTCAVVSSVGSTRNINVVDGKRHLAVAIYDPVDEFIYIYLDGVKSQLINISDCRADTEGDDANQLSGSGEEWLTIGEAGQASDIRAFFNGGIHNVLILSPMEIPQEIDAIVREWFTLGLPGDRAKGVL